MTGPVAALKAQDDCTILGPMPLEAGIGDCSDYWNYVPSNPDHFPIKRIRVMFHIFQHSTQDPWNFVPGDEYVLQDILGEVNAGLAALDPLTPNPYGSLHIPDSRVRMEFDPSAVYYYIDPNAWARAGGYISEFSTYVTNNANLTTFQKQNYLHLLITGPPVSGGLPNGCSVGGASYYYGGFIGFGSWHCATLGQGADYSTGVDAVSDNMRHELGHNLAGLVHVYEYYGGPAVGDNCADTPDCADGTIPDPNCQCGFTNNIVDCWSTCRCAMSECQLGRLHKELENRPNLFRRIIEDYCTYNGASTITIASGQTVDWSDKKELHGDLVIEAGAQLTIFCQVSLPHGGRVIVKQGDKLVVEGNGKLTNICGQFWHGIEAWGTVNQHQYPATNPTYQGLVVLKNGAIVEHAIVGFTNWRPGVKASRGGVLQVQGTLAGTGGTFLNCKRGVEFKKYRNFHPSLPTLTQNNLSYFRHADFIVNGDYRGGDDFDCHVNLWDVVGINFTQCDFFNEQISGPGGINESHKLGKGIHSLDATFSVNGHCAITLPFCEYGSGLPQPVCPDQHQRPSRFIGLDHGIDATSSGVADRSFTVRHSYFENNICGIFNEAVRGATILRNKFFVGGARWS